jgi:hypothetical protein
MPQIIVIADTPAEDGAAQVLFRERVTERLFESGHFTRQLAERLGWAVEDAQAMEQRAPVAPPPNAEDERRDEPPAEAERTARYGSAIPAGIGH